MKHRRAVGERQLSAMREKIAMQHAIHMADAADQFMAEVRHYITLADPDEAEQDTFNDAWQRLRETVYVFRSRAALEPKP